MSAVQQQSRSGATPIVPAFPSLKWWWAIREHEDLSPSLRFVAFEIGAFADEVGFVRPSLDRLKADTGLSHAQLKRLRGELVRLGYLELVKRGVGRGQASVYRLSFPQEKRLTEPARKRLMASPENGSSDEPLRETVREEDSLAIKAREGYLSEVESLPETAYAVPTKANDLLTSVAPNSAPEAWVPS